MKFLLLCMWAGEQIKKSTTIAAIRKLQVQITKKVISIIRNKYEYSHKM